MRIVTVLVILLVAVAAAAVETSDHFPVAPKDYHPVSHPDGVGLETGEDVATAIPIAALPFSETGSTCGHVDDYDVACPYPESTSPDVVYSFVAVADAIVNVSLCASSYDTKIYIYENVEGDLVCCNDDACGATGYQSFMENVFLYAGNTYYFVVDGYGGDCGQYVLEIVPVDPCIITVPPGAMNEGEAPCGPGYEDHYNGGCNSDPLVFQDILPSMNDIHIVGTSGTYDDLRRDTDWYQIYASATNTITISAIAQFPLLIFFLDGNLPLGCDDPGLVISSATGAPCEEISLTETLAPGIYWIWVGPSVFSCQPCDLEYLLTIEGYTGSSPVEDSSWATIKALYR
jgi:hypothetical protein